MLKKQNENAVSVREFFTERVMLRVTRLRNETRISEFRLASTVDDQGHCGLREVE